MANWQKNMVKALNRSLFPPFLPEGFAETQIIASPHGYIFHLRIGDRDMQFSEDGKEISSGSNVGAACRWDIKPRKESDGD